MRTPEQVKCDRCPSVALKRENLASLFAAALFFDGIHFFISGTALRGKIVGFIGEKPFQGLFSLLSLIGIVWLSLAYGRAEYVPLWGEPQALRPFALVVMLVAFIFVVLAFTTPNPTAVGGEALLAENEPAKGIQRITRHPFLWGVALWSLTHLVFNGDLASLIFFGSLLILAVGGPFSIDRKREKSSGDAWKRFATITSNVPFLALIQGRNSLKIDELGWRGVILALVLYALFLYLHKTFFGVSPLPA
ncbi:MAG: NnrU family protein [Deltaproteobacteria bacterium]|nr:NnrU family protein [Deltaproteobacteria bacterium]